MSDITPCGPYYKGSGKGAFILFNFFTFIMIPPFSLLFNKIETLFHHSTYLTSRVFNVIRLGPDDALMYFISCFTGVAQRKRAGLITPRS